MIPKVNGDDSSSHFKMILFWRDWHAPINSRMVGYPRTAGYQADGPWQSDTVSAGTIPMDVSSLLPDKTTPADKWATIHLREYLVAVDQFPEFGFYYFIVAVTEAPNICRIEGWQAHRINSSDWQQIKQGNRPALDELNAGRSKVDLRLDANKIKNFLK
jgi:hypothetical protein